MKPLLLFVLSLLTLNSFAEEFNSKVHSIDLSHKKGVPHLVKLENGRVIFVEKGDKELLSSFQKSLKGGEVLGIKVDSKNTFLSAETLEKDMTPPEEEQPKALMSYDPSVISLAEAGNVFSRMRRDYQNESQCYNRAHIWAYEEFLKTGLKSKKHFLFFTRRYIRNYRYKWWFHVSPSVAIADGTDRILDRRYTSGTRSINSWTSNFIYSRKTCPIVSKYSDYRNHQEEQDCYLIPVSMYFWQPRDIERYERTGQQKTSFIKSEVNHAYWEAF